MSTDPKDDSVTEAVDAIVAAAKEPLPGYKKSEVVVRWADDHMSVYVNSAKITAGLYDFTVDFGLVEPAREDNITRIKNFLAVRMSPQHAKVFRDLLSAHVERFEASFGPIQTGLIPGAPGQELADQEVDIREESPE